MSTIRSRFGESVTGVAVIGAAFVFAVLGAFARSPPGLPSAAAGSAPGYALAALGAAAAVALMVVQEAVGMVFRLAVFRHAAGEGGDRPVRRGRPRRGLQAAPPPAR